MTLPDVKQSLGKPVTYDGHQYTMTAYILRYTDKGLMHEAELLDKNKNSVVVAALEKVKTVE